MNFISLEKKILNLEEPVVKRKRGRPRGALSKEYTNYATIKNLLELNYTQSKIARKLGVSRQAVNSFIKYHSIPTSKIK
jgi:DNA invertase Pin-like site-specific DNA recombinase